MFTLRRIRFYSSTGFNTEKGKILQGVRADPEPLPEVAHEIWTRLQTKKPYKGPKPETDPKDLFYGELYTPIAKPKTGLGPLIAPLKWPEYDQKSPPAQQYNFNSPPAWWAYEFEDRATAPIGDYPRNVPLQWNQLKDPFKYWDKQGRREYVIYIVEKLSMFGFFALIGLYASYYDPASHVLWV
ncbi:hypothetical protein HK099_003777 [Clydaea vesicula]|uniref:Uncharacterized protein n=1 Tax=Clydaea vesicula TaxID=447962 RepID=A0AAD5U1E5_9FUNG|nr:hypothetical protein HK099_003777 [Clydaea vesicula]